MIAFSLILIFILSLLAFKKSKNNLVKFLFLTILSSVFILICLSKGSIITNINYIQNYKLCNNCANWSMFFRIDKMIFIFLLLYFFREINFKSNKNYKENIISFYKNFIFSFSLIFVAFILNYIDFNFKINKHTFVFILNNLFFIALTEEIFFRGFLFKQLSIIFKRKYLAFFISNLLFSLIHMPNIIFTILAFYAGIFYTRIFYLTNNIIYSILLHSLVNILHFIFFSYPYKLI